MRITRTLKNPRRGEIIARRQEIWFYQLLKIQQSKGVNKTILSLPGSL